MVVVSGGRRGCCGGSGIISSGSDGGRRGCCGSGDNNNGGDSQDVGVTKRNNAPRPR